MKDVRCPICRRPTVWDGNPHRPFCSERCRIQDLGNWASDRYGIPGPPVDAETNESAESDDDTE